MIAWTSREAVRASMYPSSRLTPWRQYLLAPRLELLRLRSLVAQSRASSKLKRSLRPPRPATKSDRKFDCTTQAGVLDALAQTAPAPAPTGRTIIPPPRQSYKQRPLSIAESRRVYAEMRHIEWLMAPQTPKELVWRVLAYWTDDIRMGDGDTYADQESVAEHRADRLQLEVVVRAVGEALVRRRDGLEELSFLRVRHGPVFEDDVVELAEAGRGRVAFQGQGVDQPDISVKLFALTAVQSGSMSDAGTPPKLLDVRRLVAVERVARL